MLQIKARIWDEYQYSFGRFRENPVILLNHDHGLPPIGKVKTIISENLGDGGWYYDIWAQIHAQWIRNLQIGNSQFAFGWRVEEVTVGDDVILAQLNSLLEISVIPKGPVKGTQTISVDLLESTQYMWFPVRKGKRSIFWEEEV